MKIYYFAYGSNMNFKQMKRRCSTARFLMKAKLYGYKFVYDGYSKECSGALANVVRSNGDVVEGAIYELDDKCIERLDKYEGFPVDYQRHLLEIIGDNGVKYYAYVYLREPGPSGKPGDRYRKIILEGAKDCNLSKEYIEKYLKQ